MKKNYTFLALGIETNICILIVLIYTYMEGYISGFSDILTFILGIIVLDILFFVAHRIANK